MDINCRKAGLIIDSKEKVLHDIQELNNRIGDKQAHKLGLPLLQRVIEKLYFYSDSCESCRQSLHELQFIITSLQQSEQPSESSAAQDLTRKLSEIKSHLQKQHKLIPEGHYMSIYMSLGTSIGLIFGLVLFDNIALGLPIGLCLGIAIGTSLDADAKKKGKSI